MKLSERVKAAKAPALEENPWCARVWAAMARDCAMGPDKCKQAFRLVCASGWPYEGQCECGRRWEVHREKLTKKGASDGSSEGARKGR